MISIKNWLVAIILIFLPGWILLFPAATVGAGQYSIVSFDGLKKGELASSCFQVTSPLTIHIQAVGAGRRSAENLHAYAWVFNNDARKPVWEMNYGNTRGFGKNSELREFDGEIDLRPGSYTACFYSGNPFSFGGDFDIRSLRELISVIGDALSDSDDENELDERLGLEITSSSNSFEMSTVPIPPDERVVLQFSAHEDDFYRSEGFTLERPTTLEIYAVGEYSRGDKVFVDHAWIKDADSREKVWMMESWNTDHAGGARKNRYFEGFVSLPAGDYILYCATDDSHSPEAWNSAPPYDPAGWGVALMVDDPSMAAGVKPYDSEKWKREIVSITRVGDNEHEVRYFTVGKPTRLHIYAIGEYGYSGQFVDFGFIEELGALNTVWEMNRRNTEHAGGASKNRKFDGCVEFGPGEYAVHYVTDGSHSYRRWNASPPADQRSYGISIFGVGKSFDESSVAVSDKPGGGGTVLAAITAVRNDRLEVARFVIDQPARVRIYAIGEGVKDRMYDFGWIEDAGTGRIVWKMEYGETSHAGGARKNRMVSTVIPLRAGEYNVFYETDDSHAFGDWNEKRPDDPIHWGIIVMRVE